MERPSVRLTQAGPPWPKPEAPHENLMFLVRGRHPGRRRDQVIRHPWNLSGVRG